MSAQVAIRQLQTDEASLKAYVALFAGCFPGAEKLSLQYLRWLYAENPYGTAIGFDALAPDAAVVAHYAIIPLPYRAAGRVRPCALSLNTATRPDHQGQGLFRRLAEATYDRASALGREAVYGIANANSVHGFTQRLGFSSLGQVRLGVALRAPGFRLDRRASGQALDDRGLAWRLANPEARYAARARAGDADLYARRGMVSVYLGTVPAAAVPAAPAQPAWDLRPALVPHFGFAGPALTLPQRLLPSPWHVIVKPLKGAVPDFAEGLTVCGLDMDTF